jgi:hypothetical protein
MHDEAFRTVLLRASEAATTADAAYAEGLAAGAIKARHADDIPALLARVADVEARTMSERTAAGVLDGIEHYDRMRDRGSADE